MKIGFDLDGVLCDTDLNFLRLMANVYEEDREKLIEMETLYFNNRSPLLNPEDFLSEGDEYYIITGRSHEHHTEVTMEWCRRYTPNASGVFCVGKHWEPVEDDKARKIMELDLDLFIDDHPVTVKTLREKLQGKVNVIQYGGRWIK